MKKRKVHEGKENKLKQILEVAGELFAEKGYKGASLRDIAQSVGLDKSSIFYYFKNKEELLEKILGSNVYEVKERLNQICNNKHMSPEKKLKVAIENHLHFLLKYRDANKIFFDETLFLNNLKRKQFIAEKKEYQELFKKIVIENSKHFRGLDKTIITFGILGMCNWTMRWLEREGRLSIEEIANIFYRLLIAKN